MVNPADLRYCWPRLIRCHAPRERPTS